MVYGAALEKRWAISLVGSNPTLSADYGEVLEWPIRRAWKARVALATVGSNPTLSATIQIKHEAFLQSAGRVTSQVKLFRRKTPKIGLALGSGAARGLAHIGILKALKEAAIPIDLIAGTSMGAMIGACFAKEGNIVAVEEIALKTNLRQLAHLLDPKLTSLRKGLIHGKRIEELLYSLIGDVEFKDLRIPLAAVATDVNTGQEVVITQGPVIDAVRASISIPGILVPTAVEGRCLVDGGITNPVPADILQDMGAKFIIAVNVLTAPQGRIQSTDSSKERVMVNAPNIFNTLIQSIYIMEHEIIKQRVLKADIIIIPDVSHIEVFEFNRGEETILAGYRAASSILPKLQRLIGKR